MRATSEPESAKDSTVAPGDLILAGDIGGTHTRLALYAVANPLVLLRSTTVASHGYPSLEAALGEFLRPGERVQAAAFGIAGPVIDGEVRATNLPWHVVPARVAAGLAGARVQLFNDLETTALGVLALPADRLHVLQEGTGRAGNVAVIAAGTGLGQAFLHWDGSRHRPAATEGGHADFAPSTGEDVQLLHYARQRFGHVSWERVVSGPGLGLLFRFLVDVSGRSMEPRIAEELAAGGDENAIVGRAGVDGTCDTCREAVDWFVRLYGAQAGNLALSVMALGGVYVGGSIVGKLLPRIETGAFVTAFAAKGRYQALLEAIPIRAVLEPNASLYGAAAAAAELLR